jgi:uncharacterized membrane protein YqjE
MVSSAVARPPAFSRASREAPESPEPGELGTGELVREAAGLAEELFRLEAALARDEVAADLRALKTSALALGIGLPALGVGTLLVLVAAIWAGGPVVALLVGLALVMVALGAAVVGYVFIPDSPLEATRRRLRINRALLKGHLS